MPFKSLKIIPVKECVICGTKFQNIRSIAKTCSKKCSDIYCKQFRLNWIKNS